MRAYTDPDSTSRTRTRPTFVAIVPPEKYCRSSRAWTLWGIGFDGERAHPTACGDTVPGLVRGERRGGDVGDERQDRRRRAEPVPREELPEPRLVPHELQLARPARIRDAHRCVGMACQPVC